MSLKYKITIAMIAFQLLLGGVILWRTLPSAFENSRRHVIDTVSSVLAPLASLSEDALITREFDALQLTMAEVAALPEIVAIALTDETQRIVASSRADTLGKPISAVTDGPGVTVIERDLLNETGEAGRIVVTVSEARLREADRGLWTETAITIGLLTALAALVGLGSGILLTRKLRLLSSAAVRVAAGDLSTRSDVRGDDEVGEVGSIFDNMCAALQRSHQALHDGEALYRAILDNLVDTYYRTDREGRITMASTSAEQLTGHALDQLQAMRITDLYENPERREELLRRLQDENGVVRDFEADIRRKDGSTASISTNVRLLKDAAGQPIGVEGLARDVSAIKAMEAETRVARQRLEDAIESLPASFMLFDAEDRLVTCNSRSHEMLPWQRDLLVPGTSYEALLRSSLQQGKLLDARSDQETWFRDRLKTHREGHCDIEVAYTDGRWFLIRERRTADGSIVAIRLDITDRKRAEEELQQREERLRQAAQLAGLGHAIWDSNEDKCLYCSDEYARIHGVTPDEYIARASTAKVSFNHPDDRAAYREAIMALRRGHGFEMDYRVLTPDGEVRDVREIAKPVFDDAGSVVQEICTIQDITSVKETEERLRQAQKMEAVGQLTGGVAHDFNNLLAVIQGNAEFLSDDVGNDNPMTQAILRAAARGSELTQRLLAFSRQQPLQAQSIHMATLVDGMSELLTRTLGATIEIETVAGPGLWNASADPGQVENALLNLAINARDAMPDGGRLMIECANAHLDEDYVAQEPEAVAGDYVALSVSDSGVGMSADVKAHAFEPFFTTKDVGQGSGLGLSMVYGFAKQSGGHVSIYSEEDRGTTVRLYLPRAGADRATANRDDENSDENGVPRGKNELILVIEDDPDVRILAVAMLKGLGYRVIDVPDAAAAQMILRRDGNVDLVLSDVVLPGGTSGPDFANLARTLDPDLKVIFMSGYPAEAAKRNGFLGSDKVLLNKPFQRRQLAKSIRDALD